MCHQAIEKILKSYWQAVKKEIPPKTHNLNYLASATGLLDKFQEEHLDFLDELEPLNVETRYPEHKQKILQKLDKKHSMRIYKKTKELYQWIKEKLSTL